MADRPKQRELSMEYLKQGAKSAKLLKILWDTPGKNCEGREDEFSGDELPTDREAQLMCAGCDVLDRCREYAESAHPAWGVWGSVVYGRNLERAMHEETD